MDPRDKELLRIALEARRNGGQTNTPGPPPGLWFPPQQGAGYPPYPQGYPPAPATSGTDDQTANRIIDHILSDVPGPGDTPPPQSQSRRRTSDPVDVLFWGFTLFCAGITILAIITGGDLWTG